MPTMQDFQAGFNTESRAEFLPELNANRTYIGVEIAKACGQTTDRWTRNKRAELEQMLLRCNDGDNLVKGLKTPDNRRYTQFAYELISEYQQMTSSHVPVVKDGRTVTNKAGVVKLRLRTEDDPEQKTPEQYQELLWDRYGKVVTDEVLGAEFLPEDPVEEVTDLAPFSSTRVEYGYKETTALSAEILDDAAAIASDTRATFASFRNARRSSIEQLAEFDAAEDVRAYQLRYQQALQLGLQNPTAAPEPETPPKTTKRTTRKKSVS